MAVVWARLPSHPQPRAGPPLIMITISFPHALQLLKLQHCAHVLANEPNVSWIVVEDAGQPSAHVAALLASLPPAIRVHHLAFGPTRRGGNAQRNVALKFIRNSGLPGVVYNLDDDNAVHPLIFNELRALRPGRVGVLASRRYVYPEPQCDGSFTPLVRDHAQRILKVERPLYNLSTGRFVHFRSGWCDTHFHSYLSQRRGSRRFCVDMGAFAFDSALLRHVQGEVWEYQGHGGENELIEKLLPGGCPEDLQPLGDCGRDVLTFHNEWRAVPRRLHLDGADGSSQRCALLDGWGTDRRRRRQGISGGACPKLMPSAQRAFRFSD